MDPDASIPPAEQDVPAAASADAEARRRRLGMDRIQKVESVRTHGLKDNWALVALAGWLVPGAGFWLIGQRWRGVAGGIAVVFLFVCGLFIGGVRVIDVPGYRDADRVMVQVGDNEQWLLTARPFAAVIDKPWYLGQIFAGPITLAAGYASLEAAETYPKPTARLGEIGTLYCAVAGMMNFVLLLDAAARAYDRRKP